MFKKIYITVLFKALLMLPFSSHAQNTMREIGLHVSNLSLTNLNPSFIYKKQIGENLYKRYNFSFANINFQKNKTTNRYGLNTSLGFGKEKRREMGKRLKFIHGLQYLGGIGFNYNTSNNPNNQLSKQTTLSANVGLGYLLGVQFEISPSFYINLETVPYINLSYQYLGVKQPNSDAVSDNTWGLRGDYSNAIAVNIVYCFAKK